MNNSKPESRLARTKAEMMHNLKAYTLNNDARVKTFHRLTSDNFRRVFRSVPLLLQANHPDLPGYVDNEDIPRGIMFFEQSDYASFDPEVFPDIENRFNWVIACRKPLVHSLFLIGSSGSVGHTATSDLDYWVCLNWYALSPDRQAMLLEKFGKITDWAMKQHSVEVHFYPVDLEDLAANRVRPTGEETEGEVAPLLLKEELYRTMLHVAGRRALWWAVPAGVSEPQYQSLTQNIKKLFPSGSIHFMDAGYPSRPDPKEFMAAALWLARKSEDDPFKAVLKMGLILEQVETGFDVRPLCDRIKEAVITTSLEKMPIDPYAMTIRRVLRYVEGRTRHGELELIRIAAYYKVKGPLERKPRNLGDAKNTMLERLINEWKWAPAKAERLNDYTSWTERERLALGGKMKELLIRLYKRVADRLMNDFPDQVMSEEAGLTELKARILSRYSDDETSVERLPSSLHHKTMTQALSVLYNKPKWEIYDGQLAGYRAGSEEIEGALIYRTDRAARTAAWLVLNGFFKPNMDLKIRSRPVPLSKEYYLALLDVLAGLYPPMDFKKLEEKKGWQQGAVGPRLIIVNMEAGENERALMGLDLICRTVWGEMRHSRYLFERDQKESDKYVEVIRIVRETGNLSPADIHFFMPQSLAGRKLQANLQAAMAQALGQTRARIKKELAPDKKVWLDTD